MQFNLPHSNYRLSRNIKTSYVYILSRLMLIQKEQIQFKELLWIPTVDRIAINH